ncbi:NAD(P)/FAD-dependent oxidoreductase [Microlunatus parietis]|uniref:2-polyprenyl-6-methoxyphenol hydroxylase-like FAD-dependent oxidoreductase n=1 Tax=Microlunatus parietis TaxID=682979 RepID=A0A7Y9I8K7_9ACTN|nr:NAD(P)-binding protein [Microlunatus parietis]NYE71991.1 2-polyprenyl-6-methoxyphenol hydroxylase-like FAD-dependent oxidoreductase [Microlunatus parietis]
MDGHAVILGAGFAGLLAARVLSERYERVTLIDRDPHGPGPRRGVPQAPHTHTLLCRGLIELDRLVPGLSAELVSEGALTADPGSDLLLVLGGHRLLPGPIGATTLQASRSLLDDRLRDRVLSRPGVELVTGRDVVGLVPAGIGARCAGVRTVRREPGSPAEVVPADLVVDATGRGSRLDHWLAAEWGTTVPADRLPVEIRYASMATRLPSGLPGQVRGALIAPTAECPYGLALLAVEGGRHLVTTVATGGHRAPRDEAGLHAVIRTVAPPELAEVLLAGQADGGVHGYRIPAVRRLRYDRATRLPGGVIAIGDALCGLNPVYAQGLTVAAQQAAALADELDGDPETLPQRYFRAAAAVTEAPWAMAVGSDLALPEHRERRTASSRITAALTGRIQRVATVDAAVARQFVRVMALLDPPAALTRPSFLARLVAPCARPTLPVAVG